jgi:hypothetical protein
MNDILLFVLNHYMIALDLLCGFIWLFCRLIPGGRFVQNWEDMVDESKTSFGKRAPLLGVLLGYVSLLMLIVHTLRNIGSGPAKAK